MSDVPLGYNEPSRTDGGGGGGDTEALATLLARYWHVLKRHYWIIVVTCLLAVAATYFWTEQQPRIYQSSSKIIFHQTSTNPFGKQIERVEFVDPGGRWQFEHFWNTQREVLRSRWFAQKVAQREGLLDEPGFAGSADLPENERLEIAASRVLSMFSIQLVADSRVARVSVVGTDPKLVARVADAIANTYVEYTREFQSGGLSAITDWFDTYVTTKREDLHSARSELHKYKRDNNILSISFEERTNLAAQNIQAVNTELNSVLNQLNSKEALLRQLQKMKKSGEDLRTIAELVESSNLSSAIARENQLVEDLAGLSVTYGEDHEKIRSVNDQLVAVRTHIDAEIDRIRAGVKSQVSVLKTRETKLEIRLEELKQEAFALNELGLEYNQIRDRSDSLKQLYEAVLNRSEELDINSLYESKNIQVLETAQVPTRPVSPNLPLNLAIGFALGLVLGAMIIFLLDSLDNSVKSEEHVSRYTSRPILAHLPSIDSALIDELGPIDTMTHIAPKSPFAEGIKSLRTNLMFMSPDKPPETILVTSPGPGEGKTLITLNMAIAMAQSGNKTLVIDSDLRRPRIHKALGIESKVGLSDAIIDGSSVTDLILPTEIDNLFILPSGRIPPNPSELLHTARFKEIVAELEANFDRVIFDSPPLAAVTDALVLSQSVDAVLMILKFGQTRRELLKRSVEQLEGVGAPFLGAVLNAISAEAGAPYAYYYYYRYRYEEDGEGGPRKLAG